MCQPWLTMMDWPVRALVLKVASISATSATSSTVVNSLSYGLTQHHLLDDFLIGTIAWISN